MRFQHIPFFIFHPIPKMLKIPQRKRTSENFFFELEKVAARFFFADPEIFFEKKKSEDLRAMKNSRTFKDVVKTREYQFFHTVS